MGDEFLGCICRIARILVGVFHITPFLQELLFGDAQGVAEHHRVKFRYIFRDKHHIVGRLVEYHQSVVAIIHQAARRIDDTPQEGIAVGTLLILVVADLQTEKSYDVDDHYQSDESTDHILPLL